MTKPDEESSRKVRVCEDSVPPSAFRSTLMAKVKGKNTKPELAVRSAAHRLGYRFRLHKKELPGTPDIVFSKKRKVIFVHGCFWHRHPGCRKASDPKTRVTFWNEKFQANIARDERNVTVLESEGWKVLTLWECEVRDEIMLESKLKTFLG